MKVSGPETTHSPTPKKSPPQTEPPPESTFSSVAFFPTSNKKSIKVVNEMLPPNTAESNNSKCLKGIYKASSHRPCYNTNKAKITHSTRKSRTQVPRCCEFCRQRIDEAKENGDDDCITDHRLHNLDFHILGNTLDKSISSILQ